MILLVKDNCFTPVKDDWNIMTFMYISVGGVLVADFKVRIEFLPQEANKSGISICLFRAG